MSTLDDIDHQYNQMLHNAETLLAVADDVSQMATKSDDDTPEVSRLKEAILRRISEGLKQLTHPERH